MPLIFKNQDLGKTKKIRGIGNEIQSANGLISYIETN